MLLLDLTHTSHSHARTGIQRVCRSLLEALRADGGVEPVTHDPFWRTWRPLEKWECASLSRLDPSHRRSAKWPASAQARGWLRRITGQRAPALPAAHGMVFPEIFSPAVARTLPSFLPSVAGPRIALFHDAIALKLPEHSPAGTISRFPAYLAELTAFDGIAAVSEDSRQTLVDYWAWSGIKNPPPVVTLPLASDPVDADKTRVPPPQASKPVVLSVGTLEGRKNHLALLEACERLWADGLEFQLHLIGMTQRQTGRAALERLQQLQAGGRPIRYDGPADEMTLHAAYRACAFTIYPSLMEGFGLPVLESLRHGRPCICSGLGALGESAAGGGCLVTGDTSATGFAAAMRTLLTDPSALAALRNEAARRPFRSWADYASDLRRWMAELPRRPDRLSVC